MKKRNDSSVLSNLIFRVWNLFYSQQKGLDEYIYKKKKKKKKSENNNNNNNNL
jgi:hypothetical protein